MRADLGYNHSFRAVDRLPHVAAEYIEGHKER